MRLPIIPPAELTAEQKPLFDDMKQGIAKSFQGFVNIRDDGALLGPWNPWIHEQRFGKPVWELVKAIAANPLLPGPVREVAILVTGAHFRSAYELYAHVIVAENRGLSDEKLATIVAGQRPVDLTRQEAVAFDVAFALVNGGVLPELTYRAAVKEFGEHGAAELSYLVGVYCMVSVTLNTFDVPVPD
jgi:4-carboxymuconolactone decarboxylase